MKYAAESETVALRPITYADTADIVRWRNVDEVRTHFIYQELFTAERHERWMQEEVETGRVVQMIIVDKSSQQSVGSVYIRDISKQHRKGEYGIFIGEENARGKGIGTLAAQLMLQYAFGTMGLHKVFLRVFADNPQAVRSYEKAGFIQEAYLKEDVCIDGTFRDVILMAKIAGEN